MKNTLTELRKSVKTASIKLGLVDETITFDIRARCVAGSLTTTVSVNESYLDRAAVIKLCSVIGAPLVPNLPDEPLPFYNNLLCEVVDKITREVFSRLTGTFSPEVKFTLTLNPNGVIDNGVNPRVVDINLICDNLSVTKRLEVFQALAGYASDLPASHDLKSVLLAKYMTVACSTYWVEREYKSKYDIGIIDLPYVNSTYYLSAYFLKHQVIYNPLSTLPGLVATFKNAIAEKSINNEISKIECDLVEVSPREPYKLEIWSVVAISAIMLILGIVIGLNLQQ